MLTAANICKVSIIIISWSFVLCLSIRFHCINSSTEKYSYQLSQGVKVRPCNNNILYIRHFGLWFLLTFVYNALIISHKRHYSHICCCAIEV